MDLQFYSTQTLIHTEQKQAQTSFPPDKTTQGLILLFSIDTAKGSIMGLLQATCIMPNSSGWFHRVPYSAASSSLWFKAAAAANRGETLTQVPYVWLGTSIHWWPFTSSGRRWGTGGWGEESRGEEGRRPVWLSPNEASCGYPSNTDYYVVPPLTLMGCYNDLKWFNGSQVGAPNGPLYTPMCIMNGNDSVVKCLCFFRFLSLFFSGCCSGSVTGVVLCGDRTADTAVSQWTVDRLLIGTYSGTGVFIKHLIACSFTDVHRTTC